MFLALALLARRSASKFGLILLGRENASLLNSTESSLFMFILGNPNIAGTFCRTDPWRLPLFCYSLDFDECGVISAGFPRRALVNPMRIFISIAFFANIPPRELLGFSSSTVSTFSVCIFSSSLTILDFSRLSVNWLWRPNKSSPSNAFPNNAFSYASFSFLSYSCFRKYSLSLILVCFRIEAVPYFRTPSALRASMILSNLESYSVPNYWI